MWQMLAAQTAMSLLSAGSQYKADKAQYKAQKAYQDYRNTMTNLLNAVSQNAITTNEVLSNAAATRQAIQLRRVALSTQGGAEAAAGAAGVKGRSVERTILNIQRNAAMQERERQLALESSWLSFDYQRVNSSMDAALQQDYSYLAKPKFGNYLMSALMGTAKSQGGQDALGSLFSSKSSSTSSMGASLTSLSNRSISAMKGLA